MVRFGIVLLGAVMLGACGGGSGGSGGGGGGGTTGGETSYAGPVASTDVAHGEGRFRAACSSCHADGIPVTGWTAEAMRRQIREGSGEMPAIREGRLSNEDMEALLAYLQSNGVVVAN